MKAVQAAELVDRPLVIVDSQVADEVRQLGVASVPLDDQEGRRLLSPPVAARRLRGRQAVEQPLGEAAAHGRPERLRERVDRLGPDEDVALGRKARPGAVSRPREAARPGPDRRVAARVDDTELALVTALVGADQPFHGLLGREPFAQEREALGAVTRVRVRLGGDRADVRLRPRYDRSDREELRLDGDAPLRRIEVAGGDRERRDHGSTTHT